MTIRQEGNRETIELDQLDLRTAIEEFIQRRNPHGYRISKPVLSVHAREGEPFHIEITAEVRRAKNK